ncbi:hypothetical protein N7492_006050 [Penicillium capsulatum]|uniref:PRISE-like Rossmann-fold domain-containing protein n=2 Tax=Penicillium capsulatum TaxID=69766 RepID=A0A9W9I3E3_9EURO|nr:hypothetical protein N7492_006050 [Penicillium capsulatum]KAJ6103527.1 hypothetical protein N7512_010607 [Penicillium capsulatum]KAJ6103548.1 hypothetical protein N7512_010628 [Penicillium capsulatum]KAJ6113194.1 hypothetical protein N7512_008518 [Penicillium capsulatum]
MDRRKSNPRDGEFSRVFKEETLRLDFHYRSTTATGFNMGSERYPVHQNGIYRNLPNFDPSITGLTAIVTGANGISGFHMLRALLESPERWTKVYALSRRPPPKEMLALLSDSQRSRVQHIAVDFLGDAENIAQELMQAKVTADYIFFYSYVQPTPAPGAPVWSNAEELVNVNTKLLDNFLRATVLASIIPKRFLLQTGAKHYGVQIGRLRTPAVESDPYLSHLEPNFYYPQEKSLFEYCKTNQTSWNVIRPAWVLGATTNAQMNALLPVAMYAAVQAHKDEPIAFPSDWETWQYEGYHSTALLTGFLSEWAVLEDKTKNQALNAQDTCPVSWDRLYEHLTRWFGVEKGVTPPKADLSKYTESIGKAGKDTPIGYGPPSVHRTTFTLVDWASKSENQQAWREIQEKSAGQLTVNPFEDIEANFAFGDQAFRKVPSLSMNKARVLGWTGYVDSIQSLFEIYTDLGKLGMLPKLKLDQQPPTV